MVMLALLAVVMVADDSVAFGRLEGRPSALVDNADKYFPTCPAWLGNCTTAAGDIHHGPYNFFAGSPGPTLANLPAFRRAFEKMQSGQEFKLLTLGGSMTAGTNCNRGAIEGRACSWSGQFATWLKQFAPHVSHTNAAAGGTNSEVGAASIGLLVGQTQPDIVFTDYSVNDVVEWMDFHSADGAGAFMAHKRTESNAEFALKQPVEFAAATEALITGIKTLAPNALHVMVFSQCPHCVSDKEMGRFFHTALLRVAAFHSVPVLDLRDACLVGGFCKWVPHEAVHYQLKGQREWSHPGWETHAWFGGAMAHMFNAASTMLQTKQPTQVGAKELAKYESCIIPRTSRSAFNELAEDAETTGWRLYEDRASKPGWITTEVGSTKQFTMKFGETPTLAVSYLTSYEGMGEAEIELNGIRMVLNGTIDARMSVTKTSWFFAGAQRMEHKAESGMHGFKVLGNATKDLTVKFMGPEGSKFKLISVVSC
jgi:hypothetical protein